MDQTSAEKELNRIERELDSKEQPPGKPPAKQGGWVGSNEGKSKNQSLDAVVVGGCCFWVLERPFLSAKTSTEHRRLSSAQAPLAQLLVC